MRPTSSRIGNFLSSDKPTSEGENIVRSAVAGATPEEYYNPTKAYLPANLPTIERTHESSPIGINENSQQSRENLSKVLTNGNIMIKPPLSQRTNPNLQKRTSNDPNS